MTSAPPTSGAAAEEGGGACAGAAIAVDHAPASHASACQMLTPRSDDEGASKKRKRCSPITLARSLTRSLLSKPESASTGPLNGPPAAADASPADLPTALDIYEYE